MAEQDPCELFPEEAETEEEEVEPEYQQSSGPYIPPGVRAAVATSAQALPGRPVITQADAAMVAEASNAASIVAESMTEEMRMASSAAAHERMQQNMIAPGGENPELDHATLVPAFIDSSLAATKSTWVINNSALHDLGVDPETDSRFSAKPINLLHRDEDFVIYPARFPSNLINGQYKIDPIRWVGDRMWFNAAQLDGPAEFENAGKAKHAHKGGTELNATKFPDFYFMNKSESTANVTTSDRSSLNYPWALLYEDAKGRKMYIRRLASSGDPMERGGRIFGTRGWKNIDPLERSLKTSERLNFKMKYEVHELVATQTANRVDARWSWPNFFYGHVEYEDILQILGTEESTRSQTRSAHRTLASAQQQYIGWRDTYSKYETLNQGANLNPFPFVPYYTMSDAFMFNHNTDPRTNLEPPKVGNIIFEDFVTNVKDLLTKEEADVVDIGNKSSFDIRPVYSYFDCLYEKIFSGVLTELELPSPYIRVPMAGFETSSRRSEGLSEPSPEDFQEFQFSKLQVADDFYSSGFFQNYDSSRDISYATTISTQEEFADVITDVMSGDKNAERALADHMSDYYGFNMGREEKEIFLSSYPTEMLDELYNRRYMNSMFVEIELDSVEKSILAEAMTFNGDDILMKNLFSSLVQRFDTETTFVTGVSEIREVTESDLIDITYIDQVLQSGLSSEYSDVRTGDLQVDTAISDNFSLDTTRYVDFGAWFDEVYSLYTSGKQMSPVEKFSNIFRLLVLQMRISSFVNTRSRTYEDILNGVAAYSEVLGFTIDKYEVDHRTGEGIYVNSFHIMSNNDRTVERFVDPQVKYGKVYEYRINRIVAIVGNRYGYADVPSNRRTVDEKEKEKSDDIGNADQTPTTYKQKFGIVNSPCLKIVSIPSTSKRISVVDSPPIYPNVDIIPFKNDSNRILFNLSANSGEFSAPPVILEQDDNIQFYNAALKQGLPSVQNLTYEEVINADFNLEGNLAESEMIRFKSDDPASTFEVFRIEHYPESIMDFANNKILRHDGKPTNFSFISHIKPNKKYYYIFRTEDVHNHVSNPSHIYEVELVTFNEAVRLVVNIVEPKNIQEMKKRHQESTRPLRQFMMIEPNFAQRFLNIPETGKFSDLKSLNESEIFGEAGLDKLWGKKFKLRIRSKDTGKEIDINFRFKAKITVEQENKKVNLIC